MFLLHVSVQVGVTQNKCYLMFYINAGPISDYIIIITLKIGNNVIHESS